MSSVIGRTTVRLLWHQFGVESICSSYLLPRSRRFSSRVSPRSDEAAAGLYGFHHLKTAAGFSRFVDDAIERSTELVDYISTMPSSAEIIKAMDEISDAVCSVVDSAELCRNTHPDREFVEEASNAAMKLNEYLHYLNTNHTLYAAVKRAERDGHSLSTEAHRAARHLRTDFEKGGIHLPPDKLDRLNQLNIDIFKLSREFGENISSDPGHVEIFPASRVPRQIHHLLTPIHRLKSRTSSGSLGPWNSVREKGYRITTEQRTLASVMQWTSDEEVRKMAFIKGNSVPHANLGVLEKLIAARHELSQIMDCRSYADFVVKQNLASSPEVVTSFLRDMGTMVRPKADEEFDRIKKFKQEKSGESSADLYPWDEAYYTGMMKSSMHDLDSSIVSSYFPLPHCIEGLKMLVKSLFGATFHEVPMAEGESWHPDVLKMVLHHPDEGDLGTLYLDLYQRKGKYPGCANFSIKGGRRISETEYQLPVNTTSCRIINTLLVQEWSSTLPRHHRTYSSEYYAWDYRVLKTFAKHYATGEVIPEKLVESLLAARDMFAATELQRQVFYSLVDQTLFGEQTTPISDTSSIVAELKREFTSWEHVDGTHWEARFSHLLNYGAGYYSYLYARCIAATIWKKLCKEDPLSLATGTAIRTKLLQHGGAKEPAEMLQDLAGDGILKHCNGGIVPDTTSFLEELKLVVGR
ncbi:Mitochondrial intermediate peptidase, mitochondrial [Linum perenne]